MDKEKQQSNVLWDKIKGSLKKFWAWVSRPRFIYRFLFAIVLIGSVWSGFIWLVGKPPIDATPALIMVWASIIILLLISFPNILDRLKRLKISDFELELQDAVTKEVRKDVISSADLVGDQILGDKRDWGKLTDIVNRAHISPQKSILLTVNIKLPLSVSIPMLFGYLAVLDSLNRSVDVLFISSRRPIEKLAEVNRESLIGVVSGKEVLIRFSKIYPMLLNFYKKVDLISFVYPLKSSQEDFLSQLSEWQADLQWFDQNRSRNFRNDRLTEENVNNLFGDILCSRIVKTTLSAQDIQNLKMIIERGEEYVIVFDGYTIVSVVSACRISRAIAGKVLGDSK